MLQDSRLEWKLDSQFIFLDENPCTYAVLCALSGAIRFFWVRRYLVVKLKGWNPLDFIDGYIDLSWCAVADGSVT